MSEVKLEAGALNVQISSDEATIEELSEIALSLQKEQMTEWSSVAGKCVETRPDIFKIG